MSVSTYVARRLLLLFLVLFGIATITFFVARVIPSDPAATYVGGLARKDQIETAREKLGLNEPLPVQFGIYLRDLLTGDWGTSLVSKRPVLEDIAHFLPVSFQLVFLAMAVASVVGFILGALSAAKKGSVIDHGSRLAAVVGVSLPAFVIALLLQVLFCHVVPLFPIAGKIQVAVADQYPIRTITGMDLLDALLTANWSAFASVLYYAVLPVLAVAAYPAGVIQRMTRATLTETLELEYVRMHRAMGLSRSSIVSRFAMKNALGPVITTIGTTFAAALVGAFLVEIVFSYPGIGSYLVSGIMAMDYPVIVGTTLVVSAIYVCVNLLVDLCIAWLDHRVILQ